MAEPLLDEGHVGDFGLSRQALFVDDAARRLGDVRVAFVEHQQEVRIARVVAAIGFDRVVQAQHRGRRAPLHDAAHGVEPGREGREGVGTAHLGGGEVMGAQPGADHDAERAFGAEEHLGEVGADRGAGRAAGADQGSVGEHHVETLDDVLDLPVTGRHLSRAAARDPTAHRRERHRLGPVPARDAVVLAQVVLEHVAERAGAYIDQH